DDGFDAVEIFVEGHLEDLFGHRREVVPMEPFANASGLLARARPGQVRYRLTLARRDGELKFRVAAEHIQHRRVCLARHPCPRFVAVGKARSEEHTSEL